jgi:hypothetical protein
MVKWVVNHQNKTVFKTEYDDISNLPSLPEYMEWSDQRKDGFQQIDRFIAPVLLTYDREMIVDDPGLTSNSLISLWDFELGPVQPPKLSFVVTTLVSRTEECLKAISTILTELVTSLNKSELPDTLYDQLQTLCAKTITALETGTNWNAGSLSRFFARIPENPVYDKKLGEIKALVSSLKENTDALEKRIKDYGLRNV